MIFFSVLLLLNILILLNTLDSPLVPVTIELSGSPICLLTSFFVDFIILFTFFCALFSYIYQGAILILLMFSLCYHSFTVSSSITTFF